MDCQSKSRLINKRVTLHNLFAVVFTKFALGRGSLPASRFPGDSVLDIRVLLLLDLARWNLGVCFVPV